MGPGRTTHFQVGATRISFPVYILWGLLVGFYGMFVPNTFRRGGAVLLVRTLAAGATLLAAAMVNPALRPHVDWVFKADQPYTDTSGTRLFVTDSVGWIRNSVNTMMTGGSIWSGLQWDGTTGLTCMGWSVTTFPPTANAGFNTNPGSMLLSAGTTACSSSIPVLCVEQ